MIPVRYQSHQVPDFADVKALSWLKTSSVVPDFADVMALSWLRT